MVELARARGRELAVFRDQLDAFDSGKAHVKTDAFIDMVGIGRTVSTGNLQRDDFILELAGLGCGDGALMAVVGIIIQIVPGETVLLGHHFSAGELAEYDAGISSFDVW